MKPVGLPNPRILRTLTLLALPLIAMLWLLTAGPVSGWQAQLADGQTLTVDPANQRATVGTGDNGSRNLWDGVHRLKDGTVVTIRRGVMVPNTSFLNATEPAVEAVAPPPLGTQSLPIDHDRSCGKLLLRSCGLNNECSQNTACGLARQLSLLQRKAFSETDDRRWPVEQCAKALQYTENFQACDFAAPVLAEPCHYLAGHVCVSSLRCTRSKACRTAKQWLLDQHASETSPEATRQCLALLLEHMAFPPCR